MQINDLEYKNEINDENIRSGIKMNRKILQNVFILHLCSPQLLCDLRRILIVLRLSNIYHDATLQHSSLKNSQSNVILDIFDQ